MKLSIPGLVMDHARGSDLTIRPDDSGYLPSLGHKLNDAKGRKVGKGYGYLVELTEAEAEEFQEFCEDAANMARHSDDDRSLMTACYRVVDRIQRERNQQIAAQNQAAQ
jgi:hypothetical protein